MFLNFEYFIIYVFLLKLKNSYNKSLFKYVYDILYIDNSIFTSHINPE
jgi:hypothetical protein